MRYLALAASVATYWMLVACGHLLVHGNPGQPSVRERPADVARPAVCPFSKAAFVQAMNTVKPAVADCHQTYGIPGMAMVNVVVAPSGRIASARVTGRFAGTPTGECVEKAVLGAPRLPTSGGLMTPYPFQLR